MNPLSSMLCRGLFVGAVILSAASVLADPPGTDQIAAQARQVLTPGDAAGRVRMVRGLRSLKDPALAPFFIQMGNAKLAGLRAESILALAELDPSKGVDLLSVRKLEPMVLAYVLSEALEAGLVKPDELEDLARWPDLEAGIYVSVASRLVAAQRRLDPARLRVIMGGQDPIVATVAGILLKQMGQGENAFAGGDKLLALKPGTNTTEAVRRVLGMIRDRKLGAGADIARKILVQPGTDALLRFEAIKTLLVIEPSADRAGQLLTEEMAAAPDVAERTRLALAAASAALERDSGIPAPVVDVLKRQTDPTVIQIGETLGAIASKSDPTGPLSRLMERRSAPIAAWIIKVAEKLPPDAARSVRLAIVSTALEGDDRAIEASASEAAHALALDQPALLKDPLLQAIQRRDARTAGRILGSAVRSSNPQAAFLADLAHSAAEPGEGPVWPSPGVAAVATLLRARFVDKPSLQQIEQLAKVATGSGNLPETARMQAAWLALKGATDDRAALARMLADIEHE